MKKFSFLEILETETSMKFDYFRDSSLTEIRYQLLYANHFPKMCYLTTGNTTPKGTKENDIFLLPEMQSLF